MEVELLVKVPWGVSPALGAPAASSFLLEKQQPWPKLWGLYVDVAPKGAHEQ